MTVGLADKGHVVEQLLAFAKEASAIIEGVYAGAFAVEFKGKDDPVTRADKDANALLCDRIARAFPGIPIVAEESDPKTFEGYRAEHAAFFVDPLDGTREFVARNGEFCTMLGLAEGGRATAGVVLFPALGRVFAGADGVPAFEESLASAAPSRKLLSVSTTGTLNRASLLVSRSRLVFQPEPRTMEPGGTSQNPLGVGFVVPCGSSGLKAAKVAAGESDIYAQPGPAGMLWDVCAPEAILHAAGGKLTDGHGTPFDYRGADLRCSRGVVGTNGVLHPLVLTAIADAVAAAKAAGVRAKSTEQSPVAERETKT